MTRGPRLAVVRPDYGVMGGFERHLATMSNRLTERGWSVEQVVLDATSTRSHILGMPIRPVQHEFHDDYFKYLSLTAQTLELDLRPFDVVLTTQPPTFLARHQRKVALFYHQARQFYDLSAFYIRSGFADAAVHEAAEQSVRTIDQAGIAGVRHWLAGSATVGRRLVDFWRVPEDRISLHHAPPACALPDTAPPYQAGGPVIHVGRMEWPKRPELVVQATHLLRSGRQTGFVGGGSRQGLVDSLDRKLNADPGRVLPETETWLNRGIFTAGWSPHEGPSSGLVRFLGPVNNRDRDHCYQAASVVVAPAHNEDYGLTALEAMAFARPVIVCRDGGGLTELVKDGVNGLVVDPTPQALASGIDRLLADPAEAARLGQAGFAHVARFTEDLAVSQIEQALEKALAE